MSDASLDEADLEAQVQEMYRRVAEEPKGEFHFAMDRALAERLGYAAEDLDRIPPESLESFAGVGHYFHLAALTEGENVLDLGSGSGADTFIASGKVGASGSVTGVDMTAAQIANAERLRDRDGFGNVSYRIGHIEDLPCANGEFDVVVSNGVINLSPDKPKVFAEVARVLKPGGRMAIADIVTESQLPESVTCSANLWAACIGGAMQQDGYRAAITGAGLEIAEVDDNPGYGFLSDSARGAADKWGVKSVSLLAVRHA